METNIISNFKSLQNSIDNSLISSERDLNSIELLVVTKYQSIDNIQHLLKIGHRCFGENRVQEAKQKWNQLKKQYFDIQLHLIGPLQTNKVSDAVSVFDVIQSLDRLSLVEKLVSEQRKQNKSLRYYVQINIGKESQKTGLFPEEADSFLMHLRQDYTLSVEGIMCIPPANLDPSPYFNEMVNIAQRNSIQKISMGMSNDFDQAIACGATMIRIGRSIFR